MSSKGLALIAFGFWAMTGLTVGRVDPRRRGREDLLHMLSAFVVLFAAVVVVNPSNGEDAGNDDDDDTALSRISWLPQELASVTDLPAVAERLHVTEGPDDDFSLFKGTFGGEWVSEGSVGGGHDGIFKGEGVSVIFLTAGCTGWSCLLDDLAGKVGKAGKEWLILLEDTCCALWWWLERWWWTWWLSCFLTLGLTTAVTRGVGITSCRSSSSTFLSPCCLWGKIGGLCVGGRLPPLVTPLEWSIGGGGGGGGRGRLRGFMTEVTFLFSTEDVCVALTSQRTFSKLWDFLTETGVKEERGPTWYWWLRGVAITFEELFLMNPFDDDTVDGMLLLQEELLVVTERLLWLEGFKSDFPSVLSSSSV